MHACVRDDLCITSKTRRPSANGSIVKSFIGEDGIVDAWDCCLWEPGGAVFPEPALQLTPSLTHPHHPPSIPKMSPVSPNFFLLKKRDPTVMDTKEHTQTSQVEHFSQSQHCN